MRSAALVMLVCLLGGCGSKAAQRQTTTVAAVRKAPPAGLRVGVVGALSIRVPGAAVAHGTLGALATDPLVLVAAASPAARSLPAVAAANPASHFVLIGGSVHGVHQKNLAGLVLRHVDAARLGGAVAGLTAAEQESINARVAWVGPLDHGLVNAFVQGVHDTAPGATVLRAGAPNSPAACKEAALGAFARGAIVVMARGGACGAAAAAGAHQQNHPALVLSDFELPDVAAALIVRDAVAGIYHGGEDLVYGAASGAVAVRALDPRISAATAARARGAAQQLAGGRPPSG
jgi:basic membrane lipoprotein Med (substrate-binding protein (PBP1-ABC) superfamily)